MASSLRQRLRTVARTVRHSTAYARNLVRGNSVEGDLSWTRPDPIPVILNHGFLGTRGTMQPMTRRFQRDGRIAFSYSHGPLQLRSIRASAEDLVSRLEELERSMGVRQVDMVGFSMGGLVALYALKLLGARRHFRRLVLMGTPTEGTWAGLAGVATVGAISRSVWEVLPGSALVRTLKSAPTPEGVPIRQIHADGDAFCPLPEPMDGVDARENFLVLPGGHSSLVVSQRFYARAREFFEHGPTEIEPPLLQGV